MWRGAAKPIRAVDMAKERRNLIVVTGGAGFIGSNLVAALEQAGAGEIVVCDRLGSDDKWRNIAKRDVETVLGPDELLPFLDAHGTAVETVFHLGAISATTETDVDLILANNYHLTKSVWRRCAEHGVRLIYASSAATYGGGEAGFDDAGDAKSLAALRPLNPYGWSKQLFDRWAARQVAGGKPCPPQWAGLKFFNVYGPNEYHKDGQISVALKNFREIEAGGPAVLFKSHNPAYPDGGQKRDFVWVGDCVDVMLWLASRPEVNGLFNLGTGEARSFEDLARAVFAALNRKPDIRFVDTPEAIRDKYQYFTQARMDRLRDAGYDAKFTALEDGVAAYVRDFLIAADPYR